jgi:hypothetical protein
MHEATSTTPAATTTDTKRRYLCRHVFTEGHRCGSPALRGKDLCYYHGRSRREAGISGRSGTFPMPRIDDRATIQLALYEVLSRLAGGDIDYKRGSSLLYGLQIASANLPRHSQPNAEKQPQVEEVIHDYELGDLAPIAEIADPEPSSSASESPAPPPREREYTEEEKRFLHSCTSVMGYEPSKIPRPESVTNEDIEARINASRREFGLRPINTEPGWNKATLSACPGRKPIAPPVKPATSSEAVILTLNEEKGKNPCISPAAPQISSSTREAAHNPDAPAKLTLAAVQATANLQPATDNLQPYRLEPSSVPSPALPLCNALQWRE